MSDVPITDVPTVYAGETQLLSWSDSSSTGPKIVLALPDKEALECFKTLTMGRKAGQRLMIAVTEIGDDEKPAQQHAPLMKSAALLCKNEMFQMFVFSRTYDAPEQAPFVAEVREEEAAEYVRTYCSIESRKELDTNTAAGTMFKELMKQYRAWLDERK